MKMTTELPEESKTSVNSKDADISNVVVSTVLKPTMMLRWRITEHYNAFDDAFEKVLEQKWISDTGYDEWKEIEVVE